MNYDAKGQRTVCRYANGSVTTYVYDEETFRLVRLKTTRAAHENGLSARIFKHSSTIQDLRYTYDPVGNKWVSFVSMPNPRHGVATAFLGNKLHLVSGNVTSGGGGDPRIMVHSEEHDVIEVPDCRGVMTSCP